MFCLIADKIEADPSLLEIPLANIDRWLGKSSRPRPELTKWQNLITQAKKSEAGMRTMLALLRDDSEDARWFKGFDPFPGVLTLAERTISKWISRH